MERFTLFVQKASAWLEDLRTREDGQTMAEYAVVLTVITSFILAALLLLSGNIDTVIRAIAAVIKVS